MRIELTDRDMWIERVKAAIKDIEDKCAAEDAKYEAEWARKYHSRGAWRWLIGPLGEKPSRTTDKFDACVAGYPSIYGWGDLYDLKRILVALQSNGTGIVSISGDELRMIGVKK